MKGQDVLLVLGLCAGLGKRSYAEMALSLGMSASEAHGAVRRLTEARLIHSGDRAVFHRPLCNFLIHGVPYAFPASAKEMVLGIPTAWAAPVLSGKLAPGSFPPVWPSRDGSVQGLAIRPLYSSVPKAAQNSPALYDLLALVDALRIGNGAEKRIAGEEIFRKMTALASA